MADKCPRIPTFSLEGIEAKIQILQTVIGNQLSWLEHSFGKAERHEQIINDEKVVSPVVFVDNTSDPIDVRPNDNYKAYSFWDITDPGRIDYLNQDEFAAKKWAFWEYDASLIVWANLKRLDSSPYNETKSQMRQDILDVLGLQLIGQNVQFQVSEVFDRDINQIFAGYTLVNDYNIIKGPYVAFRVSGVIKFHIKCPVSNSFSLTNCE